MTIAFLLDARAWAEPRARWTLATIAPLLDAPWRAAPAAATLSANEAGVFVGDPAEAPAAAAVVIPLRDWPSWSSAWLLRTEFEGAPLAAAGAVEPPLHARDFPPQWLPALWHALSREEEREDLRRDSWGCFSGAYTRLASVGLLESPWVNLTVATLRARLDAWCASRGAQLERVPRWNNGAPFAVALSHDVDDVLLRSLRQSLRLIACSRSPGSYALRGGLSALARTFSRQGGRGAGEASSSPDPYAQFERWAAEESRRGFRSTFFAVARPRRAHENDALYRLGDRAPFEGKRPRVSTMFRALAAAGFEIGLHGSYQSWRDEQLLATQREALAQATGTDVRATRQHFLRFDIAKTWLAQERAGFSTDATLGYNEAIGFRAGIAAPFHPWDPARENGAGRPRGGGRDLLEVPLTLMDGALFRGMGLTPEQAVARTLQHLAAVEVAGGMAGLLWHPNAAAVSLFPGWWSCFIAALDHLAARGAWVTSVGEIATWWREREQRLALGEA